MRIMKFSKILQLKTLISVITCYSFIQPIQLYASTAKVPVSQSVSSSPLSSRWYTDEDRDAVSNEKDDCPTAYDPSNLDINKNGIGDVCEVIKIHKWDGIKTLYAETITEYGGWFKFKATHNTKYNGYAAIYWSDNKKDLNNKKKLTSILKQTKQCRNNRDYDRNWVYTATSNCKLIQIKEDLNVLRSEPIILYDMLPGKVYYLTIGYIDRDKNIANSKAGNIIKIKTLALTSPVSVRKTHPRIFSTLELLKKWKQDIRNNKTRFKDYIKPMRAEIEQTIKFEDGKASYHQYFCLPAMTLYQLTNEQEDLKNALTLFDRTLDYWQKTDNFSGDSYRFQREALTYCTDALWNKLSKNKIESAAIEAINNALASMGTPKSRRFTDTDQFVSLTRSYLAVGFTFCKEDKLLAKNISKKACNVLDEGLRRLYGGLLPMARKDEGRFGDSGGYLPDGTTYEKGTIGYWVDSFWIMLNMGYDLNSYSSFFANNFLSAKIHSTTPSKKGYFAHADVQSYIYSGEWVSGEPNSIGHHLYYSNNSLRQAALLARMGDLDMQKRIQKFIASKNEAPIKDGNIFDRLMFQQSTDDTDYYTGLNTTFVESGYGMIFDRTDWSSDATYSVISASWGGFDHNSTDTGNLSIYRNKEWLLNHNVGYGGISASPISYNVARFTTQVKAKLQPYMYPYSTGVDTEIQLRFKSKEISYFVIDTTGNYNSARENSYFYDHVERSIVWFKNKREDDFIIIDYAKTSNSYPKNNIQLAINLPSISAKFTAIDQKSIMLSNSKQSALINFSPANGKITYQIHNLNGIAKDFDPFKSKLYSNYVEYLLSTESSKILQNEISIQITDANAEKHTPYSEFITENWKIIRLGENILIYPINASLLEGTEPSISKTINIDKLEFNKAVIIGLRKYQKVSFKFIKISESQYKISLKKGNNLQADENGMIIYMP